MLAASRTRLQQRGHAQGLAFHGATITFAGFDPITLIRRASGAVAALELGGFEGSEPQTFFVERTDLPEGLTITPQKSRFTCDGRTWRVLGMLDEASDVHVKITANIPPAKS